MSVVGVGRNYSAVDPEIQIPLYPPPENTEFKTYGLTGTFIPTPREKSFYIDHYNTNSGKSKPVKCGIDRYTGTARLVRWYHQPPVRFSINVNGR
jgi:hypothetical protein